jgi:seryl-tRNA synthetase
MIDPKLLRHSTEDVAANLARRGFRFDVETYLNLEDRRKRLQVEAERLRSEKNASAKSIGRAKAKGENVEPLLAAASELDVRLEAAGGELRALQETLRSLELGLPNLLRDVVPAGSDDTSNVEVRRWGEPPQFDFAVRDHAELGTALGQLDFDAAGRISGARYTVLRGDLARLQRALIQFMLDVHTAEHGYEETYVPYLVQAEALLGTGQLPKFEADLFRTAGGTASYLIPTAEVPLTNLVRESIEHR